jgi:hypothetical protein
MNKKRVPPLQSYLVTATPGPETAAGKVAKMRGALSVLSAQYGIPLRPRVDDGGNRGQ